MCVYIYIYIYILKVYKKWVKARNTLKYMKIIYKVL